MKKLILIFISFTCLLVNAQVDNRTKNQIKAKYLVAQSYFKDNNCQDALSKIEEIEQLSNGQTLAAAQNLKVKCLIKTQRFTQASKELYLLEGLSLSNEILSDIAEYGSELEKSRKEHDAKKQVYLSYAKFSDGLAPVVNNDKWGFINTSGDVVIPFIYSNVTNFSNRTAIAYIKDEKNVLVDVKGKIIYRGYEFNASKNGIIAVSDDNNENWRIINRRGEIISPLTYSNAQTVSDDMALVCDSEDKNSCGFINKSGEALTPMAYGFGSRYFNGAFVLQKHLNDEPRHQLFDKNMNKLSSKVYSYNETSNEIQLLAVRNEDYKWGFVNNKGVTVIPLKYDSLEVLRDFTSKQVEFSVFKEGFAAVNVHSEGWGYIDASGAVAVPFAYQTLRGFSEGLSAVRKNDKWGFINNNNRTIIPFEYKDAYSFIDGVAIVKNFDGKYGLINTSNNVVLPFAYMSLRYLYTKGVFLACTQHKNNCSYLNNKGENLSPTRFTRPIASIGPW